MKLDLGAGMKVQDGYLRADIAGRPEVRCDARALPFEDGAFEEVRVHHVLEHIERRDLIGVMNEIHRVLGQDGRIDVEVPVYPFPLAIADPTHVSWFVRQTFDYFHPDGGHAEHMELYGIRPWRMVRHTRMADGQILQVEMEKCAS